MGHGISKHIEAFDSHKENQQTAEDALLSLQAMAEVKAKAFYDEIVSDTASSGAKLLPVDKVTAKDYSTHCNFMTTLYGDPPVDDEGKPKPYNTESLDGAKKCTDEIKKAVGSFIKGDLVEGIGATISFALQRLISSVSNNQSERKGYVIAVGPLGGVYRVDYLLFMYKFQSAGITKVCREVLLQCWVVSSVKTDALDTNTINVILQQGYEQKPGENDTDFTARLAKLKAQVLTEITNEAMRKAALNKIEVGMGPAMVPGMAPGMTPGMGGVNGMHAITM